MIHWHLTLALILLSSALTTTVSADRETVRFDFAWRFFEGTPSAPSCNASAFPINRTGVECVGLKSTPANDLDSCRQACCEVASCTVWQWWSVPWGLGVDSYLTSCGCWTGVPNACNHTDPMWDGGERPAPPSPGPPPDPAKPDYNDSAWDLVDAPHDFIIDNDYNASQPGVGRSYLPRNVGWYRKHFSVPSDWQGASIWLEFEGISRSAQIWINGVFAASHDCAYTSFSVRIDNCTLKYGDGSDNVVAIFVDAVNGFTEWWYVGGGIYRHTYLVRSDPVHISYSGAFLAPKILGPIEPYFSRSLQTSKAAISLSLELENWSDQDARVAASVVLFQQRSIIPLAENTSAFMPVPAGSSAVLNFSLIIDATLYLWCITDPELYVVEVRLTDGQSVLDNVTLSVGFRELNYTADRGLFLNQQQVKILGFCNHNDFAVEGMAVSDRTNLFRTQTMRGVGGNGWRMSHNPPAPTTLDILDRLGVTVMNENRDFNSQPENVKNMIDFVRRDRNHAAVTVWSFCNEGGCSAEAGGPPFQAVTYAFDGTRPTLANMIGDFGGNLSHVIDIQGFSHRSRSVVDSFRKNMSDKPTWMSECCSCTNQRGENVGVTNTTASAFQAPCESGQTNASTGVDYIVGTAVWTLFDYAGEPSFGGWPHVISDYGQFDVAGFAKAAAYWYRSFWLYDRAFDASRPPVAAQDIVHIVQDWEDGHTTGTINVYSNLPQVELFVNGVSKGVARIGNPFVESSPQSWATFTGVVFSPGNITAVGYDAKGKAAYTHVVHTSGAPALLTLELDVPSNTTGTGEKLVLNGQDVALVRAVIRDAAGRRVARATNNVTLSIVSGPGRVVGTHSGFTSNHENHHSPTHAAYHGLVRGVVKVTVDAASDINHRRRLRQIDLDGGRLTRVVLDGEEGGDAQEIVVQASSPGLASATLSIPLSTDETVDGVLAVAADSVLYANLVHEE